MCNSLRHDGDRGGDDWPSAQDGMRFVVHALMFSYFESDGLGVALVDVGFVDYLMWRMLQHRFTAEG